MARFESINNSSEISHLMFRNKNNLGSRLDLNLVSMSASERMGKPPKVVRWTPLEEFLEGNPRSEQIRPFLKEIRDELSDQLPVVTRFFITDSTPS